MLEKQVHRKEEQGKKASETISQYSRGPKMDALIEIFPQAENRCQGPDLHAFPAEKMIQEQYDKHRKTCFKGPHAQLKFASVEAVLF